MTLTFVQRSYELFSRLSYFVEFLLSYEGHVNHCVTFDVEYLRNR